MNYHNFTLCTKLVWSPSFPMDHAVSECNVVDLPDQCNKHFHFPCHCPGTVSATGDIFTPGKCSGRKKFSYCIKMSFPVVVVFSSMQHRNSYTATLPTSQKSQAEGSLQHHSFRLRQSSTSEIAWCFRLLGLPHPTPSPRWGGWQCHLKLALVALSSCAFSPVNVFTTSRHDEVLACCMRFQLFGCPVTEHIRYISLARGHFRTLERKILRILNTHNSIKHYSQYLKKTLISLN